MIPNHVKLTKLSINHSNPHLSNTENFYTIRCEKIGDKIGSKTLHK